MRRKHNYSEFIFHISYSSSLENFIILFIKYILYNVILLIDSKSIYAPIKDVDGILARPACD